MFKFKVFIGRILLVLFMLISGRVMAVDPWFDDDLESWTDVADAVKNGPWHNTEGDVTISTKHAFSGTKSLKICYAGNESQSYIAFRVPGVDTSTHLIAGPDHTGQDIIYLRWREYREADYDWSGEKFNRVMGLFSNSNVTLDYPLGWVSIDGFGQPGTNGPGSVQMFGNSKFSNGLDHWKYTYKMPADEWHIFEYELRLNDVGVANGSTRLWIDDVLVATKDNVELRFAQYTIDQVWIGGWYSGGNDPQPSPACRYVDNIKASTQSMTKAPPKSPVVNP